MAKQVGLDKSKTACNGIFIFKYIKMMITALSVVVV